MVRDLGEELIDFLTVGGRWAGFRGKGDEVFQRVEDRIWYGGSLLGFAKAGVDGRRVERIMAGCRHGMGL